MATSNQIAQNATSASLAVRSRRDGAARHWIAIAAFVTVAAIGIVVDRAAARGPSVGAVGAGGGRPAGGAMSRPAPSRPMPSRPSGSNYQRPSVGNLGGGAQPPVHSRPNVGGGGFHPGGGGATIGFPTTSPGSISPGNRLPGNGANVANRPAVRPSGQIKPTQRPSTLPGNVVGGNQRPSVDRPSLGNVNRPAKLPGTVGGSNIAGNRPGGERPTTLPGNLERPTIGGGRPTTLPGNLERPTIGGRPTTRPGQGLERPVTLPGQLDRPGIGHRPPWDRPPGGWGGGQWGNRPGWGIGGGNWHDHWHDHCIHHHHHWYNGCWHGYWGSYWYVPFAWTSVGWGLGAWTSNWGYGPAYYNPYYAAATPSSEVYNYSQPVIVNNYVTEAADGSESVAKDPPETIAGLELFDEGRELFKKGKYREALSKFNRALEKMPGDPVVHETRALTLFALGEYHQAAMSLNSLLSSSPGMDWTTVSQLYGSVDDYTKQLRSLESYCGEHANDAGAHFVLAYHYLVTGEQTAAVTALAVVVELQPKDATAKRMLDALRAAEQAMAADSETADSPEIDLVGKWRAAAGQTTIELTVDAKSQFVWTAMTKGQAPTRLTGQLTSTGQGISLVNQEQGDLSGAVKVESADNWRFTLQGAPPADTGLLFQRVK